MTVTATVRQIGTGTLSTTVGVNCHCRTASIIVLFSDGTEGFLFSVRAGDLGASALSVTRRVLASPDRQKLEEEALRR